MDDMKQKIISLATDLFLTQGYSATSTRQIATALSITQPAIYHHFSNKEELYVHVLKSFTFKVGNDLMAFVNDASNSQDTLIKMSEYLKEKHPMNFSLMMRDMNHELSKELRSQIFILWQKNYFRPFEEFFQSSSSDMKPELEPKNISLHYLRCLSAYINEDSNAQYSLDIKDFIAIFLTGIFK